MRHQHYCRPLPFPEASHQCVAHNILKPGRPFHISQVWYVKGPVLLLACWYVCVYTNIATSQQNSLECTRYNRSGGQKVVKQTGYPCSSKQSIDHGCRANKYIRNPNHCWCQHQRVWNTMFDRCHQLESAAHSGNKKGKNNQKPNSVRSKIWDSRWQARMVSGANRFGSSIHQTEAVQRLFCYMMYVTCVKKFDNK